MATILLFTAVCFLAYANGANDNFKGVASLFGCGAANYTHALRWATLTTLAGSIAAIFLAQTLLIRFSGKDLVPDALIHSMPFVIAVAAGAGVTVILATRLGFPVSTTHALLGALIGSALAAAPDGINPAALQNHFIMPLLLSPALSVLLSVALYSALRQIKRRTAVGAAFCLCLENNRLADGITVSASAGTLSVREESGQTVVVNDRAACLNRNATIVLGIGVQWLLDRLHFLSAGAVCFARGLNDTPKIAALLLLAPNLATQHAVLLVAMAMALGGLFNARRVAETMSHKITAISHGQGLSANLTTALLVIFASKLGLPVSTTQVSVGALFGIGLVNRKANGRMMVSIALSWVLTLPCAALCATGIYAMV